ncbi:MAG: hypothetical protein JOY61_23905 [Chloroflexi bacterium]|nr:hypothetical protein [Chloroflexota bacterium]
MNSLIVELRAGSRCGLGRTARLGRSRASSCVRSGAQQDWSVAAANPLASEPSTYPFSRDELARLEVYRAAVCSGFYTDW